jgi:mannose/fructose-specific phosphotransferase system component IIA
MIRGIIIGHGEFSQSLLEAAERIVGKQEAVEAVSNLGLSCDALIEKIAETVNKNPGEKILFVDLPGGSCTISCMNVLKSHRELNVICGVNLPMLIEFFMLREKYPARELIPILIKKGKDNIMELSGKNG